MVYRALDPRLERQVAIKLLPHETAADPQSRERLRREAMAVAAIDHPYICKIFEIGEHGHTLFLVMEYVAGETLDDRLRGGPMPLPEALRLAGEVAEALQEAHGRRFLHRDLKSANVMVTDQGHVKVMDFGLAKRRDAVTAGDQATVDSAATVDRAGRDRRHAARHVARTGEGRSTRCAVRSVLVRRDARGDDRGQASIPPGVGRRDARRRAPRASRARWRHAAGAEGSGPATAREGSSRTGTRLPRRSVPTSTLLSKSGRETRERRPITSAVASPASAVPSSAAPAVGPASSRARPRAWWAAGVAMLGIPHCRLSVRRSPARGACGAGRLHPIDRRAAARQLLRRSPAQDYFAEGMTDELTAKLATISQLRVISRGSVMQFRGKDRPPTPEIAAKLNVDAFIEGSVSRAGDKVRITAQLIDARADKHLWAKTFDGSSRDVLALQTELAAAIARGVNVRLTPSEQSRLAAASSVDPAAHDAYLRGRYFFNRPSDDNLRKAIAQFEEAARLSPEFSLAFSGMSDAYLWAGYNEGFLTATAAKEKARASAEKAVQLDDSSAEAHTSLAVFKLFYGFDWEGCEREFRRAIALNPNYSFAHDQFGMALAFQGRFDEAIAESARAIELDPLSPQILVDATMPFLFQRKLRGEGVGAKGSRAGSGVLLPRYGRGVGRPRRGTVP